MSGGCPAGSGRVLRLDPFTLPVRFAATDLAADERVRYVELHRERVVVRRSLRGMRMALNMPVSAFKGIGLKVMAGEGDKPASVAVMLEHKDPGLALPLFVSYETDDALAEWRSWCRTTKAAGANLSPVSAACVSAACVRAAAATARCASAVPRC